MRYVAFDAIITAFSRVLRRAGTPFFICAPEREDFSRDPFARAQISVVSSWRLGLIEL